MTVEPTDISAAPLTPFRFFNGRLEFSGYVQDLTGAVRRHYFGTISAKQTPDQLILDERLFFNDGAEESRIWKIAALSGPLGQSFAGTAGDLVGQAEIQSCGRDEMRWHYVMDIEMGGKKRPFAFDDVFVQTANDTLISRTRMRKFGVTVANLYSTYRRLDG